jgi:nucleotide-binding universal stress UspA family protein
VGPVDWPVHVKLGRPAPAICTTARARKARMILLGVDSRQGQANEIAVELLHLAEKPVLVTQGGGIPRDAVIGVDFSPSSVSAAEEAVRLVGPGGRIHLVHVKPLLDFPAASVWGWGPCYECAVDGALDTLARRLVELGAGEVLRQSRCGDPAEELMAAVEELGTGLLAIGSDGYICNGRVVVGRVARRILAEAPSAVLAMPVVKSLEGPFPGLDSELHLAGATTLA